MAKRGILMLALGHHMYGNMAANAAASIRFTDSETPIHLVYSDMAISQLTEKHRDLFTSLSPCPEEVMTKEGKRNYFKVKTHAYELSPFDETLLIDVDTLFFSRPISKLMDSLSELDFTCQNRGWFDFDTTSTRGNYMHWCDVCEAQKAYNLKGKLYQLSSEVMWFKKCKKVKQMFDKAREIFNTPKLKTTVEFSGDLPDELAFNIACCMLGIKPHEEMKVFLWWEHMDSRGNWQDTMNKYHGISVGGNLITPASLSRYEQMAKAHANALRLPYHFKLYPKRSWDKQRKTL